MSAITGRDVRKTYGEVVALDGVDLVVEPGTVHGLLGPNGAGKTTLLRALLGLIRLDSGELTVTGTVGGFVEAAGAYPYLTGRQNLELLAGLDDESGDVSGVLERVGLSERADTKVAGWSFGMKQRLGIAAGLLRHPDVLVLDEPANGLDPVGARDLRQLIRTLAADGLTVLLCSHDLAEVDAVCEVATVLVGGRVRWTGTVAELRSRPGRCLLHTSNDDRAIGLAPAGLSVSVADGQLVVLGSTEELDSYVLTLASAGIAVRSLVRESLPLEQAFLELVA